MWTNLLVIVLILKTLIQVHIVKFAAPCSVFVNNSWAFEFWFVYTIAICMRLCDELYAFHDFIPSKMYVVFIVHNRLGKQRTENSITAMKSKNSGYNPYWVIWHHHLSNFNAKIKTRLINLIPQNHQKSLTVVITIRRSAGRLCAPPHHVL